MTIWDRWGWRQQLIMDVLFDLGRYSTIAEIRVSAEDDFQCEIGTTKEIYRSVERLVDSGDVRKKKSRGYCYYKHPDFGS